MVGPIRDRKMSCRVVCKQMCANAVSSKGMCRQERSRMMTMKLGWFEV